MPSVTSLVDIGPSWPAGQARNVEEWRAALLANSGWAEPTKKIAGNKSGKSKSAKPATTSKEQ